MVIESVASMALSSFPRASNECIKDIKHFLKKETKRFPEYYNMKMHYNIDRYDLKTIKTLGSGSYGRVLLVKHRGTKKYHALKMLSKQMIVAKDQLEHTLNEKKILQALNHPFMVHLEYYFSDNSFLYFVLPFVCGGEMFGLLKKMTMFDEELSKFYAAQVCLGLEYLHSLQLVYRDLKPENILIDEAGYLKITDFGFCKWTKGKLTYTLCGTPEYLAPEILMNRGYGMAVDWWSYGVLIFEMSCGHVPFRHKQPIVLYDRIIAGCYKTPQHFSLSLRNLLRNILQKDLSKRFGNLKNGARDIKDHRWFREINWVTLINKRMQAPYVPHLTGPKDTTHFDQHKNLPINVAQENKFEKEFKDF